MVSSEPFLLFVYGDWCIRIHASSVALLRILQITDDLLVECWGVLKLLRSCVCWWGGQNPSGVCLYVMRDHLFHYSCSHFVCRNDKTRPGRALFVSECLVLHRWLSRLVFHLFSQQAASSLETRRSIQCKAEYACKGRKTFPRRTRTEPIHSVFCICYKTVLPHQRQPKESLFQEGRRASSFRESLRVFVVGGCERIRPVVLSTRTFFCRAFGL
jgi:hypothetical protein